MVDICVCRVLPYYPNNAGLRVLFNPTPQKMIEMPKLAELTARIVALVSEETEIPKETILSKSRTTEAVDARHLAIWLPHAKNVYPKRIAETFGLSARSVRHIVTTLDSRIQTNKPLGYNLAKIRKQLGDNSEITPLRTTLPKVILWHGAILPRDQIHNYLYGRK